jgi:DNA-binding MarR family transcriptional regulator
MPHHSPQYETLQQVLLLANRIRTYNDPLYPEFSAKQWYLLLTLRDLGEEAPTLNTLASLMGSSHQNIRQMVSRLERKGFVRLSTDDEDRRKTRVHLTERCEPLWEKYLQVQEQSIQTLFRDISPQQQAVTLDTLRKLNACFENPPK